MLQEAGGQITKVNGSNFSIHDREVVVLNKFFNKEMLLKLQMIPTG